MSDDDEIIKVIMNDDIEGFKRLLGNKDINTVLHSNDEDDEDDDEEYETIPLWFAAIANSTELAKYMIRHGADVNYIHLVNGSIIIQYIYYDNYEMVKFLLDYGASVNDPGWVYPLFIAAGKGRYKIFDLLLEYGADIGATDEEGYNVLNSLLTNIIYVRGEYGAENYKSLLRLLSLPSAFYNLDRTTAIVEVTDSGEKWLLPLLEKSFQPLQLLCFNPILSQDVDISILPKIFSIID